MAAQATIQNILDPLQLTTNQPLGNYLVDGIPVVDWNSNGKVEFDARLAAVRAGPLDGLSVANGTAAGGPNHGGGAPAAGVAATYNTATIII